MIYLDTHVLVALYAGELHKLGRAGRDALNQDDLTVSPAAILELERLHAIVSRPRPPLLFPGWVNRSVYACAICRSALSSITR